MRGPSRASFHDLRSRGAAGRRLRGSVAFAMLTPGQLLDARYRIERHLAEGGMAHVYIAIDAKTNARVAVKVMKKHLFARPDMRARFIAEAQTAAKVQSRNVVRVLDVDEDEAAGVAYLVMELLEGETLQARLERGPMAPAEALAVLGQVAKALDAAHKVGLVHRDLKPGNVFLEDDEGRAVAKILDFGIARSMDSAHATATEIGTPAYAAPEQLAKSFRARARKAGIDVADEVSPATDVWALGLIAYECLTGAPPMQVWGVESSTELPMRILDEPPVPSEAAGEAAQSLPAGFDAWFAHCVHREARARFQAASEAIVALGALGASTGGAPGGAPVVRPANAAAPAHHASPATQLGVATFAPGAEPRATPAPARAAVTPARGVGTEVGAATFAPDPRSAARADDDPVDVPKSRIGGRAVLFGGLALVAVAGLGVAATRGSSAPAIDAIAPSASATASASAKASATASAAAVPESPCPEGMILHPGGTFKMGTPDGKTSDADERPVHEVTLSPFCLDTTEVTVAAYRACTKEAKGGVKCDAAPTKVAWKGVTPKQVEDFSEACNGDREDRGDHPANCVDWGMADAYCRWAGKRLPTEAEWEYAARCGPGGCAEPRTYPWGEDAPGPKRLNACDGDCIAWGKSKGWTWKPMFPESDGFANTAPVGHYPDGKSAFGVLDLAGNVVEWTADWKGPYPSEASRDPKGPGTEPASGSARVLRGGGWNNRDASNARGAVRGDDAPSERLNFVGFRCSRGPK